MLLALVDNNLVEASIGINGVCPGCTRPVIAKCGRQRVRHWADKSNVMCDSWWEPETEWHRFWKKIILWNGKKYFYQTQPQEKSTLQMCVPFTDW